MSRSTSVSFIAAYQHMLEVMKKQLNFNNFSKRYLSLRTVFAICLMVKNVETRMINTYASSSFSLHIAKRPEAGYLFDLEKYN